MQETIYKVKGEPLTLEPLEHSLQISLTACFSLLKSCIPK